MGVSVFEALARCATTKTWQVNMCGQFCARMYGWSASGYASALVQWNQTPGRLKHPGDTAAPAGMLMFWGIGFGHVAISDGQGGCWSIDISGPGTVTRVPASTIITKWGKPYLGWTVPYFQGTEWSVNMIKGVDVSNYQAESGWEKGVDFAFVKVTEGTSYVNPKWIAQRATIRAAGLVTGFYHFGRPGDMIAQADYFLSKISLQPGDVLAFDWEDNKISSGQKDAFIAYVQGKARGHKVILYCNTYFWKTLDKTSFAGDGLWIATGGLPAGSPGIQAPWLIHQYSTAGNLDHDVAQFTSRAAMLAWAGRTDDMPLNADDKKWITDTVRAQVTAAVTPVIVAAIKAESFAAVMNKDAVPAPTADPANPNWATVSYLRELYLLLSKVATGTNASVAGIAELKAAVSSPDGLLAKLEADLAKYSLKIEKEA